MIDSASSNQSITSGAEWYSHNDSGPDSAWLVRCFLVVVLAALLLGCTSSGKQAEPLPAPVNTATQISPKSKIETTPTSTTEPTPVTASTQEVEANPGFTPTTESTPSARCVETAADLLDAENEALAAATAIDRFLSSPLARGAATVSAGLPEPELDGSHVNQYQARARAAGLTEMLMNEEEWAAMVGWQQAWAVAESFGGNPELWDTAAEAVIEVSIVTVDRLPDPPFGIAPRIVAAAAFVARWRAAWLRAVAATDPAEMVPVHANALDAASSAFSLATLESREKGITDGQFTSSLDNALKDKRSAARKLQRFGC